MQRNLEMKKWIWLISLLIQKIVGSGQSQRPCLSKCYKGQHSPSLFLFTVKTSNRQKLLSFIVKFSVSQNTFSVGDVTVYLRNNIADFQHRSDNVFQTFNSSCNCARYQHCLPAFSWHTPVVINGALYVSGP